MTKSEKLRSPFWGGLFIDLKVLFEQGGEERKMSLPHGLANLDSTERELITNNASPSLYIEQQGTGGTLRLGGSTTHLPISSVVANATGAATVAAARFGTSLASQAAFELMGSCVVSTASGAATISAGIRVKFGNSYGWIPVYPNIA